MHLDSGCGIEGLKGIPNKNQHIILIDNGDNEDKYIINKMILK